MEGIGERENARVHQRHVLPVRDNEEAVLGLAAPDHDLAGKETDGQVAGLHEHQRGSGRIYPSSGRTARCLDTHTVHPVKVGAGRSTTRQPRAGRRESPPRRSAPWRPRRDQPAACRSGPGRSGPCRGEREIPFPPAATACRSRCCRWRQVPGPGWGNTGDAAPRSDPGRGAGWGRSTREQAARAATRDAASSSFFIHAP